MPTIADRYTDLPGLLTALREDVGHPDQTVLLPDGTVTRAVNRALDKLNADHPLIGVGTFATTGGLQAYTPLPATAYGFRRVYWPLQCDGIADVAGEYGALLSAIDPLMGPVPGEVIDEFGTRTAIEPAAVVAQLRQRAWLRRLSSAGAAIVERTVYLDPVPASAVSVIFTYHAPRYASALAVADGDVERFLTLCEHYLHARLAAGAGAVTSVSDDNEGTSISTRASEAHERAASAALRRYQRARAPITPVGAFP